MIKHGMELNPINTQAIIIGSLQNLKKIDWSSVPKISVNHLLINYASSVKYLGFTFSERFDSSNHVDAIIRKVNFSLSKISHCKRNIRSDAKWRIVRGVIDPIFDYGSIIYHGHGISGTMGDAKRIQIAHNNCIRYILCMTYCMGK